MNPVQTLHQADAALSALGPRPFHVPIGAHAPVVAGALDALGRGCWWVPGIRERVGAVLRGVPVERLVDASAGARPYKVAPAGLSPAVRALQAVGMALATQQPVVVHLGIGSASDGSFYEALNIASLTKARVVFVVTVHPLDGEAPLGRQLATGPSAVAKALDVRAVEVEAEYDAVRAAVATACEHVGPTLVEARLKAVA